MDQMSQDGQLRLTLTIPAELIDSARAEQERQNLTGLDELILLALGQFLKKQGRSTSGRAKTKSEIFDPAPLDAFLPQGTNPFLPVDAVKNTDEPVGLNFKKVQARVCSDKVPSILR